MAELLMMFAARADHVAKLIEPALARGDWVLCDRFTDASFAYQGGGRGLSLRWLETLEEMVHPGLQPDLTLLLELPIALGMQRANKRSAADRFEQEQQAFFERVAAGYRDRAAAQPQRFVKIDAAGSIDGVQAQITAAVQPWI